MEQCPNCHKEIRKTARFCTSCGFRIPEKQGNGTETSSQVSAGESGWGWNDQSAATPEQEDAADEPADSPASSSAESAVAVADSADVAVDQLDDRKVNVGTTESGDVAPILASEESISDISENRINIALFHVERLRQLIPDISGWSEEQAETVNNAIEAMETALTGREGDEEAFTSLRETVKAAKKDPRDIDVMISLTDRATDIEDLLTAHDGYSYGLREALLALKPASVEYVTKTKKPRKRRSRSTTATKSSNSAKADE